MSERDGSSIPGRTQNRTGGLLIGIAGGLAAIAYLAKKHRARRYEDHALERRNPWHFFLANKDVRRRAIDHSGTRPLFERRESAYNRY